jgi:predicted nucleic acid-binding protein
MKKIVFDSYAFIALFREEKGFELVRDLLVKMANNESEGYITAINVGEVFYMISRKSNAKKAQIAIDAISKMPVKIIEPDLKKCLDAAAIKAKYRLSYADAFAASLTISLRGTLITGDKEFESLTGETGFKMKYIF